jgi:hypothetical protein
MTSVFHVHCYPSFSKGSAILVLLEPERAKIELSSSLVSLEIEETSYPYANISLATDSMVAGQQGRFTLDDINELILSGMSMT